MTASLRRVLLKGAFWTTAALYSSAAINLLVTTILARLLLPAEFGALAAVVAITGLFGVLAETGIGSAIVQRIVTTRDELSSVFWACLAGATAIYAALLAAAPAVARLFDTPAVAPALPFVAVTVVVYGVLVVPLGLLRRDLRFGVVALSQIVAVTGAGAVALLLAFLGFGLWSLVAQSIALVAVRTAFVWIASRWMPAPAMRAADLRKVVVYSGSVAAHLTVNHFSRNADALLIARYLGVGALGYYNLAQRLIGASMQLVGSGVRPLLHPAMARIGDDVERVRRAHLELVRGTALVTFLLGALTAVAAEPFVALVWGPAWAPTARIVEALALLLAVQPIAGVSGSVFMARDATGLMLRLSILHGALLVGAMSIGLRFGVEGVAWAFSLVYAAVLVPWTTLTAHVRLLRGRARDVLAAMIVPAAAGALTFAAGAGAASLLPGGLSHAARLAAPLAASGAVAVAFLAVAGRELLVRALRRPGERDDLAATAAHDETGREGDDLREPLDAARERPREP